LKAAALVMMIVASNLASGRVQEQSSQVPANTGSSVSQHDAQDALDFHNAKRRDVGAQPLQWSAELATAAQQWANHLAADRQCNLEHNVANSNGENLFGGSGSAFNPLFASQAWYSEIKNFKYGVLTNANWQSAGHYTQMVWSNTTKVGMGKATCSGGAVVIVAEYNPPGNYMGQKPY
jgi:pathogenesis-related protein 1